MEEKLINTAFKNLHAETGIKAHLANPTQRAHDMGIDGRLDLKIGTHKLRFNAVIKNEIRNHHLQMLWTMKDEFNPIIIVARRLFPKIKEALRQMKIAYLEENGNFYLETEDHFVYIKGNKTSTERNLVNRAFTKAGLRVVFQYLLEPDLVDAPHRYVAKRAGVAVGNITYVRNGLMELGHLVKINEREMRLINMDELFDRWVNNFGKVLKPAIHIQNYRFAREEYFKDWEKFTLEHGRTFWGGEPAGKLLTEYIRAEVLTIYTDERPRNLMKKYRLIPDPNGNIQVFQKFWTNDMVGYPIAHPIVVYADLINTGDARCLEAADIIYKEIIDEHLQRVS